MQSSPACSILRYSKRRYLKFYRVFHRFAMKCFLHEALDVLGYAARECIIDNTNLARLRGSGKRAVIVPEMVSFGERYGFRFVCHEIGHANRKAGEERSFWTVETNFLPGRVSSRVWRTSISRRGVGHGAAGTTDPWPRAGLIPAQAFEQERAYLTALSPQLPARRTEPQRRDTDQYGYVPFQGNYYWVPGTERAAVKLLQYADA